MSPISRAKFTVSHKEKITGYAGWESHNVVLNPVYDSNPESENGKFYKATPSGTIRLEGLKEETANLFTVGQAYYVDFTPAN